MNSIRGVSEVSTGQNALGSTILIVDDNRDVAELTSFFLGTHGFSTTIAENGADALEKIRKQGPISLILLDLWMPVMDGWEFLKRRNKDSEMAGIPVIILSAVVSPSPAGADIVLRKPVDPEFLLLEVERRAGAFSIARNSDADEHLRPEPVTSSKRELLLGELQRYFGETGPVLLVTWRAASSGLAPPFRRELQSRLRKVSEMTREINRQLVAALSPMTEGTSAETAIDQALKSLEHLEKVANSTIKHLKELLTAS